MNSAVEFSVEDFDGYAEAVALENSIRGASCLGINEVICGLEVKPFCAAHVRLLNLSRCPFMGDATVEQLMTKSDILDDIMRFFWIVSPMYERGSKPSKKAKWWQVQEITSRDRFNIEFSRILKLEAPAVLKAILEYIDDAYIDAGETDEGMTRNYYAFEVSIAHELHEHYGYRIDFWNPNILDEENPLLVPLKLVFQFRKLRQQLEHGNEAAISNRSDKLVSASLVEIGNRQKIKDYETELSKKQATNLDGINCRYDFN